MFLSVQRKLMGGAFKIKAAPKVKIRSKREILSVHGCFMAEAASWCQGKSCPEYGSEYYAAFAMERGCILGRVFCKDCQRSHFT
jgi:G:T-mismatch repair DNA endonuclease (very short patch repair protein)